MLSSRKVYAPGALPLAETAATGPTDAYGRQKLATETALRQLLGERLTVLRLANIFGYERERPGARPSLRPRARPPGRREGRIRYAMSPFVERDFLPVDGLCPAARRDRPGAPRRHPQRRLRHPACRPAASRSGSSKATAAAAW